MCRRSCNIICSVRNLFFSCTWKDFLTICHKYALRTCFLHQRITVLGGVIWPLCIMQGYLEQTVVIFHDVCQPNYQYFSCSSWRRRCEFHRVKCFWSVNIFNRILDCEVLLPVWMTWIAYVPQTALTDVNFGAAEATQPWRAGSEANHGENFIFVVCIYLLSEVRESHLICHWSVFRLR